MEVNAAAQAAANANKTAAKAAADQLDDTFDKFLVLLTTQLKNQDPLEPMKSEEFVNQLVQFSGVEQSISTNKNLEKLIAFESRNSAISAVGLIGKTVEMAGKVLPLVNGAGEIIYALPQNAATTSVSIMDESGKVVYSADGKLAAGRHSVAWDGKDQNGNQLPDGVYKIYVAAKDADGAEIEVATGAVAAVTGVETGNNEVIVNLGAARIPFENIVAVRETKQAAN